MKYSIFKKIQAVEICYKIFDINKQYLKFSVYLQGHSKEFHSIAVYEASRVFADHLPSILMLLPYFKHIGNYIHHWVRKIFTLGLKKMSNN